MASFHQMGHDTQNLLQEVEGFSGAIASPVNDLPEDVAWQVSTYQRPGFDFILDPMLYYPRTERKNLQAWSYFPTDVDTADLSAESWWSDVTAKLIAGAEKVRVAAICSPTVVPAQYSNEFYAFSTEVGNRVVEKAGALGVWQSLVVHLPELTSARAMEIASIVSRTKALGVYVVFVTDLIPRREYREVEPLRAAIKLIRVLKDASIRTLVGYCSSDMVLWKAAGAFGCATGKFFNLRRFTPGRFDEPTGGGGQLPYWFEESVMAWLREGDVVRLRDKGLFSGVSLQNPYCQQILTMMKKEPGVSWLGLGWRQWMYWFADAESRVGSTADAERMLAAAANVWTLLDQKDIILEERLNDGGWIEPWRRALRDPAPGRT